MRDPDHFRAKAAQCRRLAAGLTNPSDIRTLLSLADEFEARAAFLEEKVGAAVDILPGYPELFPHVTDVRR